jgi:hypothetical protein
MSDPTSNIDMTFEESKTREKQLYAQMHSAALQIKVTAGYVDKYDYHEHIIRECSEHPMYDNFRALREAFQTQCRVTNSLRPA